MAKTPKGVKSTCNSLLCYSLESIYDRLRSCGYDVCLVSCQAVCNNRKTIQEPAGGASGKPTQRMPTVSSTCCDKASAFSPCIAQYPIKVLVMPVLPRVARINKVRIDVLCAQPSRDLLCNKLRMRLLQIYCSTTLGSQASHFFPNTSFSIRTSSVSSPTSHFTAPDDTLTSSCVLHTSMMLDVA